MRKLDLKTDLKRLYSGKQGKVEIVEVPRLQFLMVDGAIEGGATPGTSPLFQEAVEVLFGASYTLKFMSKLRASDPVDYPVMPLEGLWWAEHGDFDISRPEDWQWTLMILQPEHITPAMVDEALAQLKQKRERPGLRRLRLAAFEEGRCVQAMHVGPYAEEPRTVELMMGYARERGLRLAGKHHEIYLGDPRRAKPERLKTILRQPVATA